MTPGCLVFPAAVYQNVVRLDRIIFLPDTPFSFTDFPETVFMQVLGIFLMVPADPAVKKLLPGLPFPIPAVDISGIIERFQNTVVPPLLYVKFRSGPVTRMKTSHNEGVVYVGFFNIQSTSAFLCRCPVMQNLFPSPHGDRFHKCDGTVTKGISPDPLRSTIPKT